MDPKQPCSNKENNWISLTILYWNRLNSIADFMFATYSEWNNCLNVGSSLYLYWPALTTRTTASAKQVDEKIGENRTNEELEQLSHLR
jgi:hypothetical protein